MKTKLLSLFLFFLLFIPLANGLTISVDNQTEWDQGSYNSSSFIDDHLETQLKPSPFVNDSRYSMNLNDLAVDSQDKTYLAGNQKLVQINADGSIGFELVKNDTDFLSVATDGQYVYAGTNKSLVMAYNQTGDYLDNYSDVSQPVNVLDYKNEYLYSGDQAGEVHKFNFSFGNPDFTGWKLWEYSNFSSGITALTVSDYEDVYAGSNNGKIDKITSGGTFDWTYQGHTAKITDLSIWEDHYLYSASRDNTTRQIGTGIGELIEKYLLTAPVLETLMVGDYLYLADEVGWIAKFSLKGGYYWSYDVFDKSVTGLDKNTWLSVGYDDSYIQNFNEYYIDGSYRSKNFLTGSDYYWENVTVNISQNSNLVNMTLYFEGNYGTVYETKLTDLSDGFKTYDLGHSETIDTGNVSFSFDLASGSTPMIDSIALTGVKEYFNVEYSFNSVSFGNVNTDTFNNSMLENDQALNVSLDTNSDFTYSIKSWSDYNTFFGINNTRFDYSFNYADLELNQSQYLPEKLSSKELNYYQEGNYTFYHKFWLDVPLRAEAGDQQGEFELIYQVQ